MKKIYTYLVSCIALTLQASERPNILFLFSDDHAIKTISAYGGPLTKVAPTPNIDRLANEGALFLNSFCANSICGPSRATILTGKHSHKNGFMRNGNRFNPDQWTVAKALQASGYNTAVIGKWHLNTNPQGFRSLGSTSWSRKLLQSCFHSNGRKTKTLRRLCDRYYNR